MTRSLTNAEARRIALAAQGFDAKHRAAKPTWGAIAKTLENIQLLQIDSVNVLVRSHYLPLYARLGNYDRALLDKKTLTPNQQNREMFECWAHEASLVPVGLHPLFRWRQERARNGDGIYQHLDRFTKDEPQFLKETLAFITKNGPTRTRDVPNGGKSSGGWWGWSKGKLAMETLFDHGLVTTSARESFERIYDIPDRVIPQSVLAMPTPCESDAILNLLLRSARALGIATAKDLQDYFRLTPEDSRKALAEALNANLLREVKVEGWKLPAYVPLNLKIPKSAGGTALLSPFDPICWNRDRAERLFNFHYRIELYTPADKRKFGYYVLPFLHEDKLAGRLCLKADRETSTLRVNTSHHELGVDPNTISQAIAAELQLMANWLGLANIDVKPAGNFAEHLRNAA